MGKSTISMAIFNCYVSSPEGTCWELGPRDDEDLKGEAKEPDGMALKNNFGSHGTYGNDSRASL